MRKEYDKYLIDIKMNYDDYELFCKKFLPFLSSDPMTYKEYKEYLRDDLKSVKGFVSNCYKKLCEDKRKSFSKMYPVLLEITDEKAILENFLLSLKGSSKIDDYYSWIKAGFSLAYIFRNRYEVGKDLFHRFSSLSHKYK